MKSRKKLALPECVRLDAEAAVRKREQLLCPGIDEISELIRRQKTEIVGEQCLRRRIHLVRVKRPHLALWADQIAAAAGDEVEIVSVVQVENEGSARTWRIFDTDASDGSVWLRFGKEGGIGNPFIADTRQQTHLPVQPVLPVRLQKAAEGVGAADIGGILAIRDGGPEQAGELAPAHQS